MSIPKLGGKAADRPMSAGGAREAGPGSSGFQYIPEFPKALEGFFAVGPDEFWTYREVFDQNGIDGFKTRPVDDEFQPSSDAQRVADKALAPFFLTKVFSDAGQNQFREVNRIVPLKLGKKLFGDIRSQAEAMPGLPFSNFVVRLFKQGKGLNTEYKTIWMPMANPDVGQLPSALAGLKTRDGHQVGTNCTISDWLGDQVLQEYENFDPTNPANIAAYAARQSGKQQATPANAAAQAMQSPGVQFPPGVSGVYPQGAFAPPTAEQLAAKPIRELRDLALQNGVVTPEQATPDFFKTNKLAIASQLATVLLQKAA